LTNGKPATYSNGQSVCQFGIEPAGNDPILFGDTFLRSAYVVYDLANNQISMAQTNFNATGAGNILEIAAGAKGVPNVASTVTAVQAAGTASGIVRSTIASSVRGSATLAQSNTSPLACVGTNTVNGAAATIVGAVAAAGTGAGVSAAQTTVVAASGSAAAATAASATKNVAASLRAPVAGLEASVISLLPIALVIGSAVLGSGPLLL